MALSSSVAPWGLQMPAGSLQQWTFTLTSPQTGGTVIPYPISGATWEYVARISATDTSAPPLIEVTTTATTAGVITVTATGSLSQVFLAVYPAATSALSGSYAHSLWMNPGTPSALAVAGGILQVIPAPQP